MTGKTLHAVGWARGSLGLSWLLAATTVVAVGLVGCSSGSEPADLVLLDGKVATVDAENAIAEAVVVQGDRIVYVGTSQDARAWIGDDTEVIDLGGRFVMPGFIEGHGHFYGVGQSRLMLDLRGATSWQEIVEQVAAATAETPAGSWIVGRGWHQDKWSEVPEPSWDGVPGNEALSAVSPEHPVYLTHASGHAAIVNDEALELAGIDASTSDPEGGTIVRDDQGDPTGYLRETAQGLVARLRDGELDVNEARRVVQLAGEESLAKGVTSFQDAGSSFELAEFYRGLAAEGSLPVRLWVMIREPNGRLAERLPATRIENIGDHFLTVGGIKVSIDGALGSHGAWLLEPYTDLPSSSGLNTVPIESLDETARLALEHDLQLCVHAIGDRANREVLDVYEEALDGDTSKRWRIEHAQHLHPDDIPRFAELGVVAAMQGVHCTSDGPWVPERLGEQRSREGAYVWRRLLDSGAVVSNGTDAPVEDVDPIASYYASVTRRMGNGEQFYPEQVMTRDEALRSYTIDAAYSVFEEEIKGSLEEGKLADMVVLSQDLLTVPEERIRDTGVEMTILGGDVVYRAPGS